MKRWLAAIALALVAILAVYLLLVRDKSVSPTVYSPQLTATIGSGSAAVGVSSRGAIVAFLPIREEPPLPQLPISKVPKSGRLGGHVLEQAHVLGAAPAALRPYLASSRYGESGVDVELTSGIELRFGDDTQAERKWKAAVTVLADPGTTSLDYVDLQAPSRPTVGGSGHTLPELP
ncbi:MAG: cell division protein FtsQ [Solirubrobacterales bacterium]|nr:cell division protein FtsQ [Solirubrobacterales bacterium]